tara:strand:+ start:300 stop:512 length:213 start_codon:yes stop_codon:yes gene_type:complete
MTMERHLLRCEICRRVDCVGNCPNFKSRRAAALGKVEVKEAPVEEPKVEPKKEKPKKKPKAKPKAKKSKK